MVVQPYRLILVFQSFDSSIELFGYIDISSSFDFVDIKDHQCLLTIKALSLPADRNARIASSFRL